jgi:hypothetical protein
MSTLYLLLPLTLDVDDGWTDVGEREREAGLIVLVHEGWFDDLIG